MEVVMLQHCATTHGEKCSSRQVNFCWTSTDVIVLASLESPCSGRVPCYAPQSWKYVEG